MSVKELGIAVNCTSEMILGKALSLSPAGATSCGKVYKKLNIHVTTISCTLGQDRGEIASISRAHVP